MCQIEETVFISVRKTILVADLKLKIRKKYCFVYELKLFNYS